MKRYISNLLAIAVLVLLTAGKAAAADDVRLTTAEEVIFSGTSGTLNIDYHKVGNAITSVQFDIYSPRGVQIQAGDLNNGVLNASMPNHTLSYATLQQYTSNYRMIVASQTLDAIDVEGTMMSIPFVVSLSRYSNDAVFEIKNIVMVTTSGTVIKQDDFRVHVLQESESRVWTHTIFNSPLCPGETKQGGFILEYAEDATNLCGMQFDFYLDDAIEIEMEGSLPKLVLNENVVADHQVNCSKLADGGYRVVIASASLTSFKGRGAPVTTHFGLKYVPTDGRDITVKTKKVRFVTNSGKTIYVAANTSAIEYGYKVTFLNQDGLVIDYDYARPGEEYEVPESAPHNDPDNYSFHSWSPAIEPVTDHNLEYRPVYKYNMDNNYPNGTYYLQNVETGLFLQSGNRWGTQATLGAGIDLTLSGSDGDYTIDTRIYNGSTKHYLGVDAFMDQVEINLSFVDRVGRNSFKVAKEDGRVLTANGENTQVAFSANEDNPYNLWRLVTKEKRMNDLRTAAINGETELDATFMMEDPDFAIYNSQRTKAWNEVDAPALGGPDAVSEGCNRVAEKWGGNSQTFTVQQTLRGLPNGTYRLSCQGYYRYNNTTSNTNTVAISTHADGTEHINSYLMGNGSRQPLISIADEVATETLSAAGLSLPFSMTEASRAFDRGLYQNTLEFQVTDGTAIVGIVKDVHEGCDWTVFDNFHLTYVAPALVGETYNDEPLYLQNVETGLFLEAGNDWGTQASLGRGVEFLVSGADGRYTLDSHVADSQTAHYLGNNGYVDAGAATMTLYSSGDGLFTMMNEDGNVLTPDGSVAVFSALTSSSSNLWRFVTKQERIKDLRDRIMRGETNVDATFMIQCPNFGRNDQRISAWGEAGTVPVIGGPNTNMVAEKWGGNSRTFTIKQTINGLPSGTYRLECKGFYRYNNTTSNTNRVAVDMHADGTELIHSYLYANQVETPLRSIADDEAAEVLSSVIGYSSNNCGLPFGLTEAEDAFSRGLYDNAITFQVKNGTAVIGITKKQHDGCDWTVFDNFRLYYVSPQPYSISTVTYQISEALSNGSYNVNDIRSTVDSILER